MFKVRKTRYHQDVASAIKMAFTGTIENTVDIFETIPDEVLLEIFKNFRFDSMGTLARVCARWRRLAMDEVLWQKMFLKHYSLPPSADMPPGAISWRLEFKRLYDCSPVVTVEDEDGDASHDVNHYLEDGRAVEIFSQASFSKDGKLLALCALLGGVSVWELETPSSKPLLVKNKPFEPETVFVSDSVFSPPSCEFNESATLLLVNANTLIRGGARCAVLRIDKNLEVQCTNKDYDLTNAKGTWYSNEYILLQSLNSGSSFLNLVLCKVSEHGGQKLLTYHLDSVEYVKCYIAEVSGIDGISTKVIPKMDIRKDIVVERDMDVSEEGDIQHNNMPISTIDNPSSFDNKVFIHSTVSTIRFKWMNLWQIFNNRVSSQNDAKISMNGTIHAMALSPCERFIYIACFPFEKQSLEISSINLDSLDFVGRIINFPTPSVSVPDMDNIDVYMTVSTNFIAITGKGLMSGVLLDRHYGVPLGTLADSFVMLSGESLLSSFCFESEVKFVYVFKFRLSRRKMRETLKDPIINQVQDREILYTLSRWSKTASEISQHPLLDEIHSESESVSESESE